MKLTDFETFALNEVFDTKIPIENWIHLPDADIGQITIDNEQFQIVIEQNHYSFDGRTINFLNIAFEKIDNGQPSQQLVLTSKNSSKILGAIMNSAVDAVKRYNVDAVVFVANDNVEKRMRVYNKLASNILSPFQVYKRDIILPYGGRMTILLRNTLSKHDIEALETHLAKVVSK
jgi:hypothetical protein